MPEILSTSSSNFGELLFKDLDGQFKVLRNGQVEPWAGVAAAAATARSDQGVPVRAAAASRLVELVDQVVAELKLNLSDPERQKRLRQVVLSRFKDVRDVMETREALLKSVDQGGLGFDAPLADRVSRLIERHYLGYAEGMRQTQDLGRRELEASVGMLPLASPVALSHAADRAFAKPMTLMPLPPRVAPKTVPLPKPPARITNLESGIKNQESGIRPVESQFRQPRITPRIQLTPLDTPRIAPPISSPPITARPATPVFTPSVPPPIAPPTAVPPVAVAERMAPKLIGPLEELQELTLTDFRQLGPDPVQTCQRIREKIMLLEQQSFGHKAAAIVAWRKSPVFGLYTQLAARAMGGKLPIAEAMAQAESSGQETLRVSEFEAIADLNRSLRF